MVKNSAKMIEMIRSGKLEEVDEIMISSKSTISELLAVVQQNQSLRNGRLRMAIEKVVEAEMLVIFFRTGRLAMFDDVQPCSDEEYVIASLSMAQELSRYCKERACEVINIHLCTHVLFCYSVYNDNTFCFKNVCLYSRFVLLQGDYLSVLFCNAYLAAFNGAMVEFYFRNGPLRRKFDGLKYARKTVESVIFDLSLVPSASSSSAAATDNAGELNLS